MRFVSRSSLLLGVLTALGCQGASPDTSDAQARATTPPPAIAAPLPAQSIAASRRTAITTAVERVAPAVVTVQTETVERVPADFFEYFMGGRTGERRSAGIGSGFIIRGDGVIVTNAHVIGGAAKVSVALRDGTTYSAKVIGVDETNDLAVIRISAPKLPIAPLGTSTDLLVGEWTIAIGNPFGFVLGNSEPSVSVGVVSAVGRNLAGRADGGGVYVDMIQTDAAINPGNSGGPLVNASGEVIGINTLVRSGPGAGLGFAIPINLARRVADQLADQGHVVHPYLGVQLVPLTARLARDNNRDPGALLQLPERDGALVQRVLPDSPAAAAGLRRGDLVVAAADQTISDPATLLALVERASVGEVLGLKVVRGDRELLLSIRPAALPSGA